MKRFILLAGLLFAVQLAASAQSDNMNRTHSRSHYHHNRHHRHSMHHGGAMNHGGRGGNGAAANGVDGQPSPYTGDNTPSNDGERRNKERNKNYNGANNMNGGQPLPPNNGNNGR